MLPLARGRCVGKHHAQPRPAAAGGDASRDVLAQPRRQPRHESRAWCDGVVVEVVGGRLDTPRCRDRDLRLVLRFQLARRQEAALALLIHLRTRCHAVESEHKERARPGGEHEAVDGDADRGNHRVKVTRRRPAGRVRRLVHYLVEIKVEVIYLDVVRVALDAPVGSGASARRLISWCLDVIAEAPWVAVM